MPQARASLSPHFRLPTYSQTPRKFIRPMRPNPLVFRFALAFSLGTICIPAAAKPPRFMIEATVKGHYLEGGPLVWSDEKVILLARDGQVWDFSPSDAENYRKS